jgi:hypothetical protein
MNRKQEILLWAAVIIIQMMIIFPPVRKLELPHGNVEEPPEMSVVTGWVPGYGIIVRDYKHIRFGMLALQAAVVAAVTAGLLFILREKEPGVRGSRR